MLQVRKIAISQLAFRYYLVLFFSYILGRTYRELASQIVWTDIRVHGLSKLPESLMEHPSIVPYRSDNIAVWKVW